jgi:murE/murF fusion protein
MLFSKLLQNIFTVDPHMDCEITGLSSDSRNIKPGFLFVALAGENYDGRDYINKAMERGAVAVIDEKMIPDLRNKLGDIAARFYDYPAREMTIVGITGTNGKTSCSQFLAEALQINNIPCGIIGTLGIGFPGKLQYGIHTTPDPIFLQQQLSYLHQQGAKVIAMEVSSHALEQGRVNGIDFNIAIFTNLSRDHLDYHGNMQNYAAAKQKLFERPELQHAIINVDDDFGLQLMDSRLRGNDKEKNGNDKKRRRKLNIIGYCTGESMYSPNALIHAENIKFNNSGFNARVITPWGEGILTSKLLGRFNVSNLLAVIGALGILKIPLSKTLDSLSKLTNIPGRMQTFGGNKKPLIVIDFAHTPDALQEVLTSLREHCKGSLWCVFGCGGDRDRGKRPLMGEIAERLSDHIIITDDNPRTEDAEQIVQDIMHDLLCPWAAEIEHDRGVAIAHAIECAKPEDIVLIAGKGHEPYQIIGTEKIPFNDAEHVGATGRSSNNHSPLYHNIDKFQPINIDTRTLQAGDVFIALHGENFDGHDFVKQAEQKGAKAAVVDHDITANIPIIKVDNTSYAFGELAAKRRNALNIPILAVTGSCGKTTTKNILGKILPNSLITAENLNNNIGVPLTLLRLTPEHKFAVIEMGANAPHEIAYAAKLTKPTVAIITCAAPVHLQGFGDLDGVARVKGDILQDLTDDGTAVLNADDKYFSYWNNLLHGKHCISFGLKNSADITAHDITITEQKSRFVLQTPVGEETINLPLPGKHNIMNALAASAAAYAINISLADIKNGLQTMQPMAKRMIRKPGKNNSIIIDDSYSANPQSMQAAIKVLSLSSGEKILVIGDMGELGDNASQYHHELGIMARELGVNKLYALGQLTQLTVNAFGKGAYYFINRNELIAAVANILNANTIVLIKGSNVNRMWEIVAALQEDEK